MKRIALFLIITTLFFSCSLKEKSDFEKHFFDKTLRINIIHTGNDSVESFKADKIYDDGLWYGKINTLKNPYRLGDYYYELIDVATNEIIYSEGISRVFNEWRKSQEATKEKQSFNETIRIPYPQKDARLVLYSFDSLNVMHQVWEYAIDRRVRSFVMPTPNHNNRIIRILDSGDPKEKVDIVILGDGYTDKEAKKFDADVNVFCNKLFSTEPYMSRKSDFNVHAIQVISPESGVADPSTSFYPDNILKTGYFCFGHDRYALTCDEWAFREYATQSPYDFAVILLNSDKTGGSSFYNLYLTAAINSQSIDYVINHALGHLISGFVDTYYSDEENGIVADSCLSTVEFNEAINSILDLYIK